MDKIFLKILGTPVPNNTKVGRYRLYKPTKVQQYKQYIQSIADKYMREHNLSPTNRPVEMKLDIGLPIPASWSKKKRQEALAGKIKHKTKPDSENFAILIKNALQKQPARSRLNSASYIPVYINDSQICRYSEHKFYTDKPFVFIVIEEI